MNKRLIVILILLQVLSLEIFPQNLDNDNRLRAFIHQYGQVAVTVPQPGSWDLSVLSGKVSISSVKDKKLEIVLSTLTVEWFISQKYNYTILENDDAKGIVTASDTKQAMEWAKYPTYAQYDSIMQSFASLYPALCHLDTIGTTNYGKLVLALKISDNPLIDEEEPETFYSSSIHGDETGGFILMLRLADYLLKNYSLNSRIKNLIDNLEIWINPLANPDGTYRTGNIISSPTRYNANGYDLNRNFPDPDNDDPVKQKETIDMIKFMREHNFVLSANFHGGEEVVNYPWDRWPVLHPDNDWFYNISRKYADTVHLHSPTGYMTFRVNGVTNGWQWYFIYGGRQDFVTLELQGREVTIELSNTKLVPAASLNTLWESNWRSLLGYIENALYGIHGKVTDFITGEAVPAKIFIEGHDADSSHIYSDTVSGEFVRLIAPGAWTLKFTADGYMTKTVDVTVENEKMSWIDVQMVPIINPIDTVSVSDLLIYPNPANEYIHLVLPDRQIGSVGVRIINSVGIIIMDKNDVQTIEDFPVEVNVQDMPAGMCTIIITNSATKVTDKTPFIIMHRK
ncbi:MAG: M14 family zinc carboxypeptidase [Bacteroidia bacterium]|nr:M14 family zinc carboxypeptidase [Bacteroidia bacterium]